MWVEPGIKAQVRLEQIHTHTYMHTHTHAHALRHIHLGIVRVGVAMLSLVLSISAKCMEPVQPNAKANEAKYFTRYLIYFGERYKAHVEKLPSVTRELWLLALRARVVLLANFPLALFSVKTVEITASRISVCMRDLCAALLYTLGRYAEYERQHCHTHSHYPVTLKN